MKLASPIIITDADVSGLASLVAGCPDHDPAARLLAEELDRAEIVPSSAVSPSVVTMRSRVVLRDGAGASREVTLVYPAQADPDDGRISVLAPLGRALLGASVGDHVEVSTGRGARRWVVEEIRYQPEAAGDE